LKQPVVLGYLAAGLIVGPHVPIPLRCSSNPAQLVADRRRGRATYQI
jgi:Kef-type K+ transport system membrane component KefB